MKPSLRSGTLIKWQDERGFGFIQPVDGSPEVFLHISELKQVSRRPLVGDTIYYYVSQQEGKLRASDAFILGARLKPAERRSPADQKSADNSAPAAPLAPFPGFELLLLSMFPLGGALHFVVKTGNLLPLLLYPAMSLVSYALYADDKARARQNAWRIEEKTLLLCDLAGGWMGGFVAQRRLHHKNRKSSYQGAFWLVVAMHYLFWLSWLITSHSLVG